MSVQKPRRWAPPTPLARRIARLLVLASRDGRIQLGGWTSTQCQEWQWMRQLHIAPRMKIGALWRAHGRDVLSGISPDAVAPEQFEDLQHALRDAV